MSVLDEAIVGCPYCGEHLAIGIEPESVGHPYIEDCQVCCRPIVITVEADGTVTAHRDDE